MCGTIRSVSLWRERSNYSRRLVQPVEIVSFDVSAQRGLISVSDCRYSFCERTAQALAESNTMSGCDVGAARDRYSHGPPCDKPRLAMRSQIDYFRDLRVWLASASDPHYPTPAGSWDLHWIPTACSAFPIFPSWSLCLTFALHFFLTLSASLSCVLRTRPIRSRQRGEAARHPGGLHVLVGPQENRPRSAGLDAFRGDCTTREPPSATSKAANGRPRGWGAVGEEPLRCSLLSRDQGLAISLRRPNGASSLHLSQAVLLCFWETPGRRLGEIATCSAFPGVTPFSPLPLHRVQRGFAATFPPAAESAPPHSPWLGDRCEQ